jgi:hypothetical protein
VSYSYSGNKGLLSVGASLGGDQVRTILEIEPGWSNQLFDELRFRGATGGYSSAGEVCEFRWFGGEIANTAIGDNDLPNAFTNLDFLAGP